MRHWLTFYGCVLVSLWIVLSGLRALLHRRRRPPGRALPAGTTRGLGFRALSRLLAAAGGSPYSRDQIQGRLRLLAQDLEALDGGAGPEDGVQAAYFAEDHVGFRDSGSRKRLRDPGFLPRTEVVLQRLEHRGTAPLGDPP